MFHVKHLFRKPRWGIALGGGGVRALSCIGVLKHFEQNSIEFNHIAGTSMGAVVGALYSYYRSAEMVEEKIREAYEGRAFARLRDEFSRSLKVSQSGEKGSIKARLTAYYSRLVFFKNFFTEPNLISATMVRKLVEDMIPEVDIEQLPLNFCCVGTNIASGTRKVFKSGPLRDAIIATTAVPGILAPLKIGESILTDGGSVSMTPVEELRDMGAEYTVAVEVFPDIPRRDEFETGIEILERTARITSFELHRRQISLANLVISPRVKDLVWSEFEKFDYAVAAGEIAAFGTEKSVR